MEIVALLPGAEIIEIPSIPQGDNIRACACSVVFAFFWFCLPFFFVFFLFLF